MKSKKDWSFQKLKPCVLDSEVARSTTSPPMSAFSILAFYYRISSLWKVSLAEKARNTNPGGNYIYR